MHNTGRLAIQSQSPYHIHPIILMMIPAAVDIVDIIAQVCNQLVSYVQLLNLQNASWLVKFNRGDYIYIEPQCYSGCHNGGTCISPNKCKCASGWTGYTCSQGRTSDNNFGLCSVSLMYVQISMNAMVIISVNTSVTTHKDLTPVCVLVAIN